MLHSRMKRVSEEFLHELNRILAYELRDPRLPMATVTQVKISKDLREALVHVSFLEEDPQAIEDALAALESARGYIKRLLAGRIVLKRLPDPKFVLDTTTAEAYRLFDLMERLHEEDDDNGDRSDK